jgi:NAD(P)H-dependent flavin oxidoreductase YrpB (nitropropane dioxygenase family)
MGTRFLATRECPVSDRFKQALVEAYPWDPEYRDRALAPPQMEEYEKVMKEKGAIPQEEWLQHLEQVMFGQSPGGAIDWEHDWNAEVALRIAGGSLAVGVIESVMSVRELIDTIIRDAEEILRRGSLGRIV